MPLAKTTFAYIKSKIQSNFNKNIPTCKENIDFGISDILLKYSLEKKLMKKFLIFIQKNFWMNIKIPIFADGKTIIPSIVCYKDDQFLIGDSARYNMTEYYKTTMFESKRLLGLNLIIKKYKIILKIGQIK